MGVEKTVLMKFDPLDTRYKSTVGGIKANVPLTFNLRGRAARAVLVLRKEGEGHVPVNYEMNKVKGAFTVTVTITTTGLYFYYFLIDGVRYAANAMLDLIVGGEDYMQLVYQGEFKPIEGVIYQIMPDRFNVGGKMLRAKERASYCDDIFAVPEYLPDENGDYNTRFYGGNMLGVTQKLDYLSSLGVTYIYFNPVFLSPSSHRYDTSDYEKIDNVLGDEKDLVRLIAEAGKRNMGIILDGVFSHTGSDSRYFNSRGTFDEVGAAQSEDSPYYNWYSFEHFPDRYRCWWGFETLPEVNENEPSYMDYIMKVVRKWESLGIAGWRLDVADELPDEFLDELRRTSKGVLIGEVWENAARKISYDHRRRYLQGQLDGVTNYPLRSGIIDFLCSGDNTKLRIALRTQLSDYPASSTPMNILGTHDTERILTALSTDEVPGDREGKKNYIQSDIKAATSKLKIASLIQFMLPGTPCIYYGDEAGLFGHADPFCRKFYPWGRENTDLIEHYRALGSLRKKYAPIFMGATRELSRDNVTLTLKRSANRRHLILTASAHYAVLSLVESGAENILMEIHADDRRSEF